MDILESPLTGVNAFSEGLSGESAKESPTKHVAAEAALVTNTESASTSTGLSSLQAPSLQAFENYGTIPRRYVLQSISKELLDCCRTGDGLGGGKPFFYRLGACQQLSTSFRPDSRFEESFGHALTYAINSGHTSKIHEVFAQNFSAGLSVKKVNGISSVQMSGLCSCDSSWICPVCQPKVSEHRAKELAYAVHQHQVDGGYCLFVTFTVPHTKKDSLDTVISGLTDSLRRFKSGQRFKLFKQRHGFIGSVRALEWTYTDSNGHHPHVHELWFMDEKPDLKTIKDWVYKNYASHVLKHLGSAPSYRHGLDIRLVVTESQLEEVFDGCNLNDMNALTAYISKGVDIDKSSLDYIKNRDWSIADEMTKSNYKKSRKYKNGKPVNSLNAPTLLLEYMQLQHLTDISGKKTLLKEMHRLKSIYTEYAHSTFGRAALYWSKGLKDRFGVYDLDDKLLIEEHDSEFYEFMSFDLDELQFIIKNRLRAKLCHAASSPSLKNDDERREVVKVIMTNAMKTGRVDRFG